MLARGTTMASAMLGAHVILSAQMTVVQSPTTPTPDNRGRRPETGAERSGPEDEDRRVVQLTLGATPALVLSAGDPENDKGTAISASNRCPSLARP